jgi:hypothetical protein
VATLGLGKVSLTVSGDFVQVCKEPLKRYAENREASAFRGVARNPDAAAIVRQARKQLKYEEKF